MAKRLTEKQHKTLKYTTWLFSMLGMALILLGYYFVQEAIESENWPATKGTVLEVKVTRRTSSQQNNKVEYYYSATYGYKVEGQSYTGSRYSLGSGSRSDRMFNSRPEAERAGKAAFPIGSNVVVYYNPDNPDSTVLKPGANWGTYVPIFLGLFFGGFGYMLVKVRQRSGENSDMD